MNDRQSLEHRWQAVAAELADIAAHRILPECQGMTERELSLLAEQDRIEYEIGMMDAADSQGRH